MSAFLTELSLAHFRGACEPVSISFNPQHKIVLISGNNGTGKSTICDALDFIGCSNVGSLEDKKFGSGGTDKRKFLPSIKRKESDLKVGLKCLDGTWEATLGKKEIVLKPGPHALDIRVLRRSNILKTVEANPKDRYAVMREFIDLSRIEASEDALRQAAKNVNSRANTAVQRFESAQCELEHLWNDHGKPDNDPLTWGRAVCAEKIAPAGPDPVIDFLNQLQSGLIKLGSAVSDVDKKREKHAEANGAWEAAKKNEQDAVEILTTGTSAEMLNTLESVVRYFEESPNQGDCPVCLTQFTPGQLRDKAKQRIAEMKQLQKAAAARRLAEQALHTAEKLHQDASEQKQRTREALQQQQLKLEQLNQPDCVGLLTQLKGICAGKEKVDSAAVTDLLGHIKDIIGARQTTIANIATRQRTQKQIKRLVDDINAFKDERDALASANVSIAAALKIAETERKKYVDEVLADISGEVNRLYSLLHPGENIGSIKLAVRAKGQGSVEIIGDFHDETDVPPEAFFSESHLDTLGICIFIALAKARGSNKTVLVFDDVITSVDNHHVGRLVQLIATEAPVFGHIIITTHLELLGEWFRHDKTATHQTQFLEIADWSRKNGFRLVAKAFQTDLLRNLLKGAPLDKQSVGGKAGFLLEMLLKQIALSFSVSMPLKNPQRYVLSEYFQSFTSDVRNTKVTVTIETGTPPVKTTISLATYLDPIENSAWIRNVMAHGNIEKACQLPDSDVKAFAELVLKLNDEFCARIPAKKRQPC